MTPVRLAAELGASARTLRAFVRRRFPRPDSELGNEWTMTPDQVAVVRHHFEHTAPATPGVPGARRRPPPPLPAEPPLRPYVRPKLDVLFVALTPHPLSALNGHWFSGKPSRFFELLHLSGLITADLSKATADEAVFGGTQFNHKGASYGVMDLDPDRLMPKGKAPADGKDLAEMIRVVRANKPHIVCVVHQKIWTAFNKLADDRPDVVDVMAVGRFTRPLAKCPSQFICSYFPNGNSCPARTKIGIFAKVRFAL